MRVTDRFPQHAGHDQLEIAQLAADDLRPSERPRVETRVATCPACAELLGDLRSLAAATSALPPVPTALRPRDFRLTDAEAARLRRRSWRDLLRVARSPRFAFTQPLGVGVATLALVGLLVTGTSVPFLGTTAPTAAPVVDQGTGGPVVREAPATGEADGGEFTTRDAGASASAAPAAMAPAPGASGPTTGGGQAAPQGADGSPQAETMLMSPGPDDSTTAGAPADAMPAATGPAIAGAPEGTVEPTPTATVPTSSALGWLVLLVAGIILVLLRPIAARLSRR